VRGGILWFRLEPTQHIIETECGLFCILLGAPSLINADVGGQSSLGIGDIVFVSSGVMRIYGALGGDGDLDE